MWVGTPSDTHIWVVIEQVAYAQDHGLGSLTVPSGLQATHFGLFLQLFALCTLFWLEKQAEKE